MVSEDLETTSQYLPRLFGQYTVRMRLPPDRFQKTNSVRFSVSCEAEPLRLTIVPGLALSEPELEPITVRVIDTAGQPLAIPYSISGSFERLVTLEDDPSYVLVEVQTEGGTQTGERSVRFSPAGGSVTYILERKAVAIPLPEISLRLPPRQALDLPTVTVETLSLPLPVPEIKLERLLVPNLILERSEIPQSALPCEIIVVDLDLRNAGNAAADYQLFEHIPPGFVLLGHDPQAQVNELLLSWQGSLGPGASLTHRYELRMTAEAASSSELRAFLKQDGREDVVLLANLGRLELRTQVLPDFEGEVYEGDEFSYTITVFNPLNRDLQISLYVDAGSRLDILELGEMLLPALGSASTTLKLRAEQVGRSLLQVAPYLCDPEELSGPAVPVPVTISPFPKMPEAQQSTTVSIDLAAYDLPVLEGLILLQELQEGMSYLPGSSFIDGEPVADPLLVDNKLVYQFEGDRHQLRFTVVHSERHIFDEGQLKLIGLTPRPDVLWGKAEVLEFLNRAEPVNGSEPARERIDAVMLNPLPDAVFRERDRITVAVDTPERAEVSLRVNGELVAEEAIGKRIYDPNIGRQTFEYVGVPLQLGPNELVVESLSEDGIRHTDSLTVYFAGAASAFSIEPLSPLTADSAQAIQLELVFRDDWGHSPMDGLITLEIEGSSPRQPDASPERTGFQLRSQNGRARLDLEPLSEPGSISISVWLGDRLQTEVITVSTELRPWIVTGVGSVVGAYNAEGFNFGVGGAVFARGTVFEHYLLTFAAGYPPQALGPGQTNPYQEFPLPGASGTLNFEALSRHGVYARLERDLSYLQYGDFVSNLQGALLNPSRSYTGLSANYLLGDFGLRGYASYQSISNMRSSDLLSDGTSARFLPDAPIEGNSLSIEIIKKDDLGHVIREDNDPLTRKLQPLLDFRVNEQSGLLELFRPVPLADRQGQAYYLRVAYRVPQASAARHLQFGVQGTYVWNDLVIRTGVVQEQASATTWSRVVASQLRYEFAGLDAELELAYGSNQDSGGLALRGGLGYRDEQLVVGANYSYYSGAYRSPQVTSDALAGHSATVSAAYALTESLGLAGNFKLTGQNGRLETGADLLGVYRAASYDLQFGVNLENAALRPQVAANLYDIIVKGSRFGITHKQGLGTSSTTRLTAALPLVDVLKLTVASDIHWGQGSSLMLGLEASLENNQLLGLLCQIAGCEPGSALRLGSTRFSAQYAIPGGLSAEAANVRLGIDSNYPITEALTLQLGAEHKHVLSDSTQNQTVLRTGISYVTEAISSSLRYEINWTHVNTKQVLAASSTFALGERLYSSLSATLIQDSADKSGMSFGIATAYRGDRLVVLSNTTADFGAFAPPLASGNRDTISGDLRLTWTLSQALDLRLGYVNRWLLNERYLDLVTAGMRANLWSGGGVYLGGRVFSDWTSGDRALGLGLELSQRLGCGVYGVAGYNHGGLGSDYGTALAAEGLFIRFDFVFDEEWRCFQNGGDQ